MTPRYMNNKIESKNNILFTILTKVFVDKMNLTQIKFFGFFICTLCKLFTLRSKLAEVRVDSLDLPRIISLVYHIIE